jgi:ABC-type dipeptide/oligopeptide/nickel transport system permease component
MPKEVSIKNNKYGLVSLVLGIFSVLFSLFVIPSIILGIISIIFAILQFRKGKSKMAIAGIILSIIGIALSVYLIMLLAKAVSMYTGITACQKDPSSVACNNAIETLSSKISPELANCIKTPNTPECQEMLAQLQTQYTQTS